MVVFRSQKNAMFLKFSCGNVANSLGEQEPSGSFDSARCAPLRMTSFVVGYVTGFVVR
jgi:hypothetical protein